MKAKTRMFGEIDIQEDKIITLESGMIGFPDMQKFTLIFDEEKGSKSHIMWLQSMDDPQTAFPVINPVTIKEDYNPSVSEELLIYRICRLTCKLQSLSICLTIKGHRLSWKMIFRYVLKFMTC